MIMAMIVPGRYHGDPIRHSAKREVPHISGKQKVTSSSHYAFLEENAISKSEDEIRF